MNEQINLLDHGYLRFVENWGSDESIVCAARMSTNKSFQGWGPKEDGSPGDEKLLGYLWENKHATPFEMAGMTIEVQAPIFVFREWHRHRTFSYSELSSRYTPIPNFNYVPTVERLMMGSDGKNKQAGTVKDADVLTEEVAKSYQMRIQAHYSQAEDLYQISLKAGIPKELARVHLPVGRYSRMRASGNLRNWLAFLTLRTSLQAQWEIRVYAEALSTIIGERFPRTHKLWAAPK